MKVETRKLIHTIALFAKQIEADIALPQRGFPFLREWLTLNYKWLNQRPAIPSRKFFDLYPAARDLITPMELQYLYWSIPPLELYYLSCFSLLRQPRRIFEFGTYNGATTLQLARMCPESHLWTIDLAEDPTGQGLFVTGSRFHGTAQERQITQLYGDSRRFDAQPLAHSMDLVFIDGGHDADCVLADTRTAFQLVTPGGVIWWDDYLNWPGVKHTVERVAKRFPAIHIVGTRQALLDMTQLAFSNTA